MEGPITTVSLVDLINLLRALNIANIRNVFTSDEVPNIERLWNKMLEIVKSHGVEDIYCDLNETVAIFATSKSNEAKDIDDVAGEVDKLTVDKCEGGSCEDKCEGGVCKIGSCEGGSCEDKCEGGVCKV